MVEAALVMSTVWFAMILFVLGTIIRSIEKKHFHFYHPAFLGTYICFALLSVAGIGYGLGDSTIDESKPIIIKAIFYLILGLLLTPFSKPPRN